MKHWDITVPIHPQMTKWPSHPPIQVERYRDLCCGDSTNSSMIHFSVHTGTHVDAPNHFFKDGKSVENLSTDILMGPCYVAEINASDTISTADLEQAAIPPETRRLLLRTKNSDYWKKLDEPFHAEYVALSKEAALWMVERGIQLVGIDYLSIQKYKDSSSNVHEILFNENVIVVEGLDLSQVENGNYHLICLPLLIKGCDGSPARVILTDEK